MKIQIGEIFMNESDRREIYPNKTRRYLLPCLKEYGTEFTKRVNNVFKVAVGIGDIIVKNSGFTHEKHLFVLLDSSTAPKHFISFIEWIREQPMYEDDYVFDNIQKSTYHMVIIKFPGNLYESFDIFKEGKYSKMFAKETIDKFFERFPNEKKVFIQDNNYKIKFTRELNKLFNTTVKPNEYTGELDFPPTEESEIFNHYLKRK